MLDYGLREITGRVIGDESAFDSLRGPPSEGYRTTNEVGPLSALTFNRGRTGARGPYWQKRPPLFAARAFERALKRRDVVIGGAARTGRTQAGALPLAEQRSATMAEIARLTNRPSDNFNAETLIKALGEEFGAGGTTRAGAAVVRRTMTGFGLRPRVADGSGLSRSNRTTPRQVVRLLQHMAEDDEAGPAFQTSLAVAGRSGTLEQPHAPQRRARPLPGQDRHAQLRVRAGGLLPDHVGRARRLRLPHDRRQRLRRPPAAGPHDVSARPLLALTPSLKRLRARLIDSSASSCGYQPSTLTTFQSGVL